MPLTAILMLALAVRVGFLTGLGYIWDIYANASWGKTVAQYGLARLYALQPKVDYPPLYMAALGVINDLQSLRHVGFDYLNDGTYRALLKVFPVLGDLALIIVVYFWLAGKRIWRWLIPAVIALSPAVINNSAWWGQSDSLMALLLVLTAIAFERKKPLAGWVFFSIGVMLKFQVIALVPLVVILTLYRHGIRKFIAGVCIIIALSAAIMLPPLIGSGSDALHPFIGAVGDYPYLTVNAYNFWVVASPPRNPYEAVWPVQGIKDDIAVAGGLTYKHIGLIMLAVYTLLISVTMLRQHDKKREFVWAAALLWGFFMLPTEIHERYLFPGYILVLIATTQDRRLWPVALGASFTLAYNVTQVSSPGWWLGIAILPSTITVPVAVLNVVMFIYLTYVLLVPPGEQLTRFARWGKSVVDVCKLAAEITVIGMIASVIWSVPNYTMAIWIAEHIPDHSHLVFESRAELTQRLTYNFAAQRGYYWDITNEADAKSPATWKAGGVDYLLLDSASSSKAFSQRLEMLSAQGATVLYDNDSTFGAHQAVLWTYQPQIEINNTFDNNLELNGIDVKHNATGTDQLVLYWSTIHATSNVYHLFVHLLDPNKGEVDSHLDIILGGYVQSTNTWQPNQRVTTPITLPSAVIAGLPRPYQIRLGLYQIPSMARATVGNSANGYVDVTIP